MRDGAVVAYEAHNLCGRWFESSSRNQFWIGMQVVKAARL